MPVDRRKVEEIYERFGLIPPERDGIIREGLQATAGAVVDVAEGFSKTAAELGAPSRRLTGWLADVKARNQHWQPYTGYRPGNLLDLPGVSRTLATGVTQSAGFLGAGAAATLAGGPLAGAAATTGVAFAQIYGREVEEFQSQMEDQELAKTLAAFSALGQAAIEAALGPEAMVRGIAKSIAAGALRQTTRKLGRSVVMKAVRGGVEEGLEEVFQDYVSNLARGMGGVEVPQASLREWWDTFAAGAVPGAVMGGGAQLVQNSLAPRQAVDADVPPPPSEGPEIETDLVARINAEREQAGLQPLAGDSYAADTEVDDQRQAAERIADALGIRVRFVRPTNPEAAFWNGRAEGDTLYLARAENLNPVQQTLGHEFAHYMHRVAPRLAQQFSDYLQTVAEDYPAYAEKLADLRKRMLNATTDSALTAEEFTADVMGEMFLDTGFWEMLGSQDQTIAQKVMQYVIRFLDTMRQKLTGSEEIRAQIEKQIEGVRQMAAQTVAGYQAGRQARAETVEAGPDARAETAEVAADAQAAAPEAEQFTGEEDFQQWLREGEARRATEATRERGEQSRAYQRMRAFWGGYTGEGLPESQRTQEQRDYEAQLRRKAQYFGLRADDDLGKVIDRLADREARSGRRDARFSLAEERAGNEDPSQDQRDTAGGTAGPGAAPGERQPPEVRQRQRRRFGSDLVRIGDLRYSLKDQVYASPDYEGTEFQSVNNRVSKEVEVVERLLGPLPEAVVQFVPGAGGKPVRWASPVDLMQVIYDRREGLGAAMRAEDPVAGAQALGLLSGPQADRLRQRIGDRRLTVKEIRKLPVDRESRQLLEEVFNLQNATDVLSDNGKAGMSADFLLATCHPTTPCKECYAAKAYIRMSSVRKAFRNTVMILTDPEGWADAMAKEAARKKRHDLPFIRLLGSGDLTVTEMRDGFNALARKADRPIQIFSRHHDFLGQLEGTSRAPFIKMGSLDAELYRHYGPEFLEANMAERGIANCWLYTDESEQAALRDLADRDALALVLSASHDLHEGLPPDLQMKSCPCDAGARPYHASCRWCALANGGCFMAFSDRAIDRTGRLWIIDQAPDDVELFPVTAFTSGTATPRAWAAIAGTYVRKSSDLVKAINLPAFRKGEKKTLALKDLRRDGDVMYLGTETLEDGRVVAVIERGGERFGKNAVREQAAFFPTEEDAREWIAQRGEDFVAHMRAIERRIRKGGTFFLPDSEIQEGVVYRGFEPVQDEHEAGGIRSMDEGTFAVGDIRYSLANPARDRLAREAVDYVDRIRAAEGLPGRQTVAEWQAEADDRIAGSGDQLWEDLAAGRLNMDDPVNTMTAKRLIDERARIDLSQDSETLRRTVAAVKAYRAGRSQIARAMRAGFDPVRPADPQSTYEAVMALIRAAFLDPGDLDPADIDTIRERLEKARRALAEQGIDLDNLSPEDVARPEDRARIVRAIQTAKAGLGDMAYEWWINGLLSLPATHAANILGNTVYAVSELTLQRAVEATLNLAARKQNAATWGEFRAMTDASRGSLRTAFRNAAQAWETERPVIGYGQKLEGGPRAAIPGRFGRAVRTPGRALLWADEFAKSLLVPIEAAAFAHRQAKAEGLTGDALSARVRELAGNPDGDAVAHAQNRALELTFQKRPGAVVGYLLNLRAQGGIAGNLVKYTLPFLTTPSNILKTSLRKSPLGTLSFTARLATGGYRGDADRAIHDAAEQILAWGAVGALASLAGGDDDEPLITGAAPRYGTGEYEFRQRAMPPMSVRIGDRWFSYARIEPFAGPIALIVDAIEGMRMARNGAEGERVLRHVMNSATQNIRDKTFLQTVGDLVRATEDPRSAGRLASSFVASWIPNAVRGTLRRLQSEVPNRRNYGRGFDYWKQQFSEQIAVEAGLVPAQPKVDVWGREIPKSERLGYVTDVVWRLTSPVYTHAGPVDPLDRLLWNWNREHPEEAYWPGNPGLSVTVNGQRQWLNARQHLQYSKTAGRTARKRLDRLVRAGRLSPDSPTDRDIAIVRRELARARAAARRELISRPGR